MADIELELHVDDFVTVEQFYVPLGFTVERSDPVGGARGYLVLRKGDSALRFWPGTSGVENSYFADFPPGTMPGYRVEIVVKDADLDATYDKATAAGIVVSPMTRRPWGSRDFRVADPFGFYLRFTEPHDATITPTYED
jgi:hypothetical protein